MSRKPSCVAERVSREEGCRRVLQAMLGQRGPWVASQFGDAIWPGHRMSRQGAAVAGSPVMRMLARRGDITLALRLGDQLGWVLAAAGPGHV